LAEEFKWVLIDEEEQKENGYLLMKKSKRKRWKCWYPQLNPLLALDSNWSQPLASTWQ